MVNESIEEQTSTGGEKTRPDAVEMWTPNRQCRMKVRAVALPFETSRLLEESAEFLKLLHGSRKSRANEVEMEEPTVDQSGLNDLLVKRTLDFRAKLEKSLVGWKDFPVVSGPACS